MIPRTFAFVPVAQRLQINRFLCRNGSIVNSWMPNNFVQLRFKPTLICIGHNSPIGTFLTEGFGWKNQDEAAALNEEFYSEHVGSLELRKQSGWRSRVSDGFSSRNIDVSNYQ